MKSVWLKLNDFNVERSICPTVPNDEFKFQLNSVRNILSREVGNDVGKLYSSHVNNEKEHLFTFQCNHKICQVKWRIKLRPHDDALLTVEIEKNDVEHHHVVRTDGRLSRSIANYVKGNNELSSMFLLKKIKVMQSFSPYNDKELKKKISHAKWYYTRKENMHIVAQKESSLESLKKYIEANLVSEKNVTNNLMDLSGSTMKGKDYMK